jgi:hypothetical protein
MVLVLANTISNVLWFLPPIYHRNRVKAVEQLKMNMQERRNAYKYPIHRNAIPQCDVLKKTDTPKKK